MATAHPPTRWYLAQANGVISQAGTDTFVNYTAHSSDAGNDARIFFVGLIITPRTAGQFPAAFDESAPISQSQSWIAANGDGSQ